MDITILIYCYTNDTLSTYRFFLKNLQKCLLLYYLTVSNFIPPSKRPYYCTQEEAEYIGLLYNGKIFWTELLPAPTKKPQSASSILS